ncbi:hypothetical protein T552_00019 [Pneumocystis carinii B80]|uniref:Alpha-1,4 glucan phosphorylase n=1 Tax=Pneumocystis carinii (strain B80) TaxID=1408658 RepID=A0A0W4ZSP4_PNEC8|nr:hypothetical protein T552_00019 [Pneumocystis carinii B80]KTW31374.1 hypothetical protein T552_00019 [Pneumocystis carinii B80]
MTSTDLQLVSEDDTSRIMVRHKRTHTGLGREQIKFLQEQIPESQRNAWESHIERDLNTKDAFERDFVRYVETTLARSMYNCYDAVAYRATAYSVRDRLITRWNKTQQTLTLENPKRVYYLSIEFLMGRTLDNSMLNLGIKDMIREGISELGFNIEDIIDAETDAALGNGGLGRLAACFLDSLSSLNLPAWGYGLRYQYGIFKQQIVDGHQIEQPDYWLQFDNPWEMLRHDVKIPVRFYGYVKKYIDEEGKTRYSWQDGEQVLAVASDVPIPGYGTNNTNNLRLWSSRPMCEFDFSKFNAGDYESSVREQQRAETLSAVLYPNENVYQGKELRLKQQYFWVCASLHDIIRRFKKSGKPWCKFPEQVFIQLNDTHPALAIVELQRVLVDLEHLEWDQAWSIVLKTFGYTNHTILPEAFEKWPIPMFQSLLPRHMQIIYDINFFFLQLVEKKFPKDRDLLSRVSIVEESSPKYIRMAYLAVIGSSKVNGVAKLHSNLIKTTIFKDFVKIFGPDKFVNITNGVTPRRWLLQANPTLSNLISKKLGGYDFLVNLSRLKELEKYAHDKEFQREWREVKLFNKARLAKYIEKTKGLKLNIESLFDIHVKRIHEYKRQTLNIFGVIYRYLKLKAMSKEEIQRQVPRVSIFGGKAAPGYFMAKCVIKLINFVADVVNNDEDIGDIFKVHFIEDYNVSKAEIIIPASDISEHISTAGTEASGTSNMKFALNGGLIIGTVDGSNIEITHEIGEENIFLFGNLSENVNNLRHKHVHENTPMDPELKKVCDAIESGTFGDPSLFAPLINALTYGNDYYLISDDFQSYLNAHDLIDETFRDKDLWTYKTIISVANMGFFSSDRTVQEYAEGIWNIEACSLDD